MKIQKVTFLVKKTIYQQVELTENNWGQLPKTGIELIDLADDIRNKPHTFCDNDEWGNDEIQMTNLEIIEQPN
tara:strand:+ start:19789 stop:20007 length:219 start_codon:yes stop_codon:yes gene_type:complete